MRDVNRLAGARQLRVRHLVKVDLLDIGGKIADVACLIISDLDPLQLLKVARINVEIRFSCRRCYGLLGAALAIARGSVQRRVSRSVQQIDRGYSSPFKKTQS